jgi:glycosyltransferase involved in cell wall biosynthesis
VHAAGFLIDEEGSVFERVDIVALALGLGRPFLPAAFFRRRALLAVGIERDEWAHHSFELDLCHRVMADCGMAGLSRAAVSCRNPAVQVEGIDRPTPAAIADRIDLIDRIFSAHGFFGPNNELLCLEAKANQLSSLWRHFRALGRSEVEWQIMEPLLSIVSRFDFLKRHDVRVLRTLHRLLCARSHNLGHLAAPLQSILAHRARHQSPGSDRFESAIWKFPLWGNWLTRKIVVLTFPTASFHPLAPPIDEMYRELYVLAGQRYECRGQIDHALAMWDRAGPPFDPEIDGLACQSMLKGHDATDVTVETRQANWVSRHAADAPHVSLPFEPRSTGKIRVGYHCSFMGADTIRYMMRDVMTAHDRTRFDIYGYGPFPVPEDIAAAFDVFRVTPSPKFVAPGGVAYDDDQFLELVRSDNLDIFLELSGFSPGHRFTALSRRCAPIQINYINHTGTSGVPNVDYILSDETCTPSTSGADKHYSEEIYRLPGCVFCYDYSRADEPAVAAPPHLRNGFITFACLGSGGKINVELVEVWAKILHRVPASILYIQNAQLDLPVDVEFMVAKFGRFGIPRNRLRLEGGIARTDVLGLYRDLDVSLDTWPYCGGNTIAESLWHGVPVITYQGPRFSGAYGASLLAAAGCADLVATSLDDYVERAVRLACDSDRLVDLRRRLRQMHQKHGLGDSVQLARRLDAAYSEMVCRAPGNSAVDEGATGEHVLISVAQA